MRYGVREICEVVLKAKGNQKIGNKIFYKDEPVLYFDSLKTSSMEGAAETVYATGGRGNSRLAAWEGERTVTFTMEDALISPVSFMILSGAGLIEAKEDATIKVHTTEQTDMVYVTEGGDVYIQLAQKPYLAADGNYCYVMLMDNGEVVSEPYIPMNTLYSGEVTVGSGDSAKSYTLTNALQLKSDDDLKKVETSAWPHSEFITGNVVMVDYYVERPAGVQQIEITPDKFGGNYYLEASTLWRGTDGIDVPAEFIIPNCKIQSNFTFTMAATGDPSTFTFTMDAFPDYTRFDKTKKVLAVIQLVTETSTETALTRPRTQSDDEYDIVSGQITPGPTNSKTEDNA